MPQKPIRKREKQRQEQPSLQRQREQQETQGQEKISSSATNDQHNNNNETGSVDFTMAPSAETWVPHVATGGAMESPCAGNTPATTQGRDGPTLSDSQY